VRIDSASSGAEPQIEPPPITQAPRPTTEALIPELPSGLYFITDAIGGSRHSAKTKPVGLGLQALVFKKNFGTVDFGATGAEVVELYASNPQVIEMSLFQPALV